MNSRIKSLRKKSLGAIPKLSHERAMLLTEFMKSGLADGKPVPIQRAMALRYILENTSIYVGPGEWIVGERGPAPRETPTYPEICLHSLEDLDMLDSREKVSYKVDPETKAYYKREVIPYWKGRNTREKIMNALPEEWHMAYEAGIFTEFQEQRAPGHTVSGDKIYKKGMLDLRHEIEARLENLDYYNDPRVMDKRHQLEAMHIAAGAIISFARRHAAALNDLAAKTNDPEKKDELHYKAGICNHVPAYPPRSFHEALQAYWFIHLGVITELNPWDSFNPGRLDQHLWPFYKSGIEEGSLTRDHARELLQAFWLKFNNHPAPPKVGVTAEESGTYTDFALINLGGLKPDGADGVSELSYLMLDVVEEMRLLQPGSMVQVSNKTPDAFLARALKIISTGFGQPSVFNTDAIIQELLRQGKELADARNGGASGCVETGAFGKECYILTGYFNLPKVLEITLNNGTDPLSGKEIGIRTGKPGTFKRFDGLLSAYQKQLQHFIDIKIKGNNIIESIFAREMPAPFLSLLIDDCIQNARDYNAGGAKYNTSYIQGVGAGSLTDSLAAIKYRVFDRKQISLERFQKVLSENYEGLEDLRGELVSKTPKYGNDNDYADNILKKVFNYFFEAVDNRPTARGGKFRINLLPTTSHIYFGKKTGALPDGRKAFLPLSEGISPVQGTDRKGPTAVILSAARIDHIRTGGTLLNQKFNPEFFEDEEGILKVVQLIRTYFKLNGHHIQFNVVTADLLRKAKKDPEKYADLIVRVAGYSDYFKDLSEDLQDEIIQRTEHKAI